MTIHVTPEKPNTFQLNIRIPGWARGDAFPGDLYSFAFREAGSVSIRLNGKAFPTAIRNGYAEIERKWMPGDVVELVFPMSVHQINANQLVEADAGRIALQRGPLVYCLEGKDQPDERVLNLLVSTDQEIGTNLSRSCLAACRPFAGGRTGGAQNQSDGCRTEIHAAESHSLLRLGKPGKRLHDRLAAHRSAAGAGGRVIAVIKSEISVIRRRFKGQNYQSRLFRWPHEGNTKIDSMPVNTITASPMLHENQERIRVDIPYDTVLIQKIRTVNGARWSALHRCWHVPKTAEAWQKLQRLFPDIQIAAPQPETPAAPRLAPLPKQAPSPIAGRFVANKISLLLLPDTTDFMGLHFPPGWYPRIWPP
ncbi:MAG: glycoside hydrolase family 127 protein [Lewinellaceae bacterium]|nr:glycoside hydrolase family 127 protein [Lewinellaceae bacterium]